MTHNHHTAGEAPHNHTIQYGLLVSFLIIWILDSFILRFTAYVYIMPFFFNIFLGIPIIIAGVYLASRAHIVFETPEPQVVDTGLYSRVRHPMYLGSILLYVGFWVTTLSLLTLIPLFAVIIGYNYLASAEERMLTEKFGDEYLEYKKRVSKWIPL
ncbi:MAG: methyltransferase family protein [Promethearchaeota archaeon]